MLDLSPEVWRYMVTCWGVMVLGYLGGCMYRWQRGKRKAANEQKGWEEVSL